MNKAITILIVSVTALVLFPGAASRNKYPFAYQPPLWEDLKVPVNTLAPGATAADVISFNAAGGLRVRGFDGNATTESMEGVVQFPHSWKVGSEVRPHIHWAPTTTGGGNVRWCVEYTWVSIGATTGANATDCVTDAAGTTAWVHHIASLPAVAGTGKGISSVYVFRIYRDPTDDADTYGADAALLEFDLHVQLDTPGSMQELSK